MPDKKSDKKRKTYEATRLTKGINIPAQTTVPPMPPVQPPKKNG